MDRRGDWMQTYTGRQFWPLDPREDEVNIVDIAHALSLQCRYAGHCRVFYSVAEHSVRVSQILPAELKLAGLLHDAAEAYVVDVPRPVKRYLGNYAEIEEQVHAAICERFGITVALDDPRVKAADETILATEARDLMGPAPAPWNLQAAPLAERIVPMGAFAAELAFLAEFDRLTLVGVASA